MQEDTQIDVAIAAGAITSPVWLHALNEWMTLVGAVLGVGLILIRIWKAVRK